MIAQILRRLKRLEEAVKRLQPSSSPGMLTSQTTTGTTRKPTAQQQPNKQTTPTIAVWG